MQSRFSTLAVLSFLAIIATACGAQPSSPSVSAYGPQPTAAIPATGATATQPAPATSMPAATQPPSSSSSSDPYGGGYGDYGSGSGSTATQAAAAPAAAAQVALVSNPQFGSILVDATGKTLYLFTRDSANTPSCYGGCASAWPPLLASSGSPAGAAGLDASKFGTAPRTDGTVQVTYNGWPLYYFAKDLQPGDVKGQGLNGAWFVVSPTGDPIR